MIVLGCCLLAKSQSTVLTEAQSLISSKKYQSAYEVLEQADPQNTNPELTIEKVNLVLDYFVSSVMHRMFALKDLLPNEKVESYRGKQGAYTLFKFAPDSVLNRLIKTHPRNYKLRMALGHYYQEVHLNYGDQWLEADSLVLKKLLTNYTLAYQHGVYDYWSLYGMGYTYLLQEDYPQAITYLLLSLQLKGDFASGNYNLAYAYFNTAQYEKSIIYAARAIGKYENIDYKTDAIRLTGLSYLQLNDSVNAYRCYQQADELQPNNYFTLQSLLSLSFNMKPEVVSELTEQYFQLAPENPTIYQDLMGIYWTANKIDMLLQFFDQQHDNYTKNAVVNGNLYFYSGVILYDTKDFKSSKKAFSQAQKTLSRVYPKNHEVFKAIDSYLKEM